MGENMRMPLISRILFTLSAIGLIVGGHVADRTWIPFIDNAGKLPGNTQVRSLVGLNKVTGNVSSSRSLTSEGERHEGDFTRRVRPRSSPTMTPIT